MDWATRRVPSWHVSTTMDVGCCLEAVEEAITRCGCPEIFNTDQGAPFTSAAFTGLLQAHVIPISMDGQDSWRANIFVERPWGAVTYEELYLHVYSPAAVAA